MGHLRTWETARAELASNVFHDAATLARNQSGSHERRSHHNRQRGGEPDAAPDIDEERNLDERHRDERQDEHGQVTHPAEDTGPGRLQLMNPRDLPSVDVLTERLREASPVELPWPLVTMVARSALDDARAQIGAGGEPDPFTSALPQLDRLASIRPQRVINATGVLLHTNLGRAPIPQAAADLAAAHITGYGNVEFDLATGDRGGRSAYVQELLTAVTGAEAALAVNNNAGALLLALATLAGSGNVVVSRGELIEIGGSFRLPALMEASGASLVEVGTTNRTRLSDYDHVMADADLILKVHTSNYRIEGFAEEVGYRELAELANRRGIPFVADVGSGLLDTRVPWLDGSPPQWLGNEPGVRQVLDAGAGVVLFSGDKLLGGPQAGIAVGHASHIVRMARHPVARALRTSGAAQAALSGTLELYASGRAREVPFWSMATLDYDHLETRHRQVLDASGLAGEVVRSASVPGAGSVPGELIPSPAIRLPGRADASWKQLLTSAPPIVGRRQADALLVDLRTVDPKDDRLVAGALADLT